MVDLSHLASLAANRSGFVASRLSCYLQEKHLDDAALASLLGCELADLTHLRLCSLPRAEHFDEDVATIAAHTHAKADVLAQILSVA